MCSITAVPQVCCTVKDVADATASEPEHMDNEPIKYSFTQLSFVVLLFHPLWSKKECSIYHLKNGGTRTHLLLRNYLTKVIDLDRKENESASLLLGNTRR